MANLHKQVYFTGVWEFPQALNFPLGLRWERQREQWVMKGPYACEATCTVELFHQVMMVCSAGQYPRVKAFPWCFVPVAWRWCLKSWKRMESPSCLTGGGTSSASSSGSLTTWSCRNSWMRWVRLRNHAVEQLNGVSYAQKLYSRTAEWGKLCTETIQQNSWMG